jgi:hypothetical protein
VRIPTLFIECRSEVIIRTDDRDKFSWAVKIGPMPVLRVVIPMPTPVLTACSNLASLAIVVASKARA